MEPDPRPSAGVDDDDLDDSVADFVRGLQEALSAGDAEQFNRQFASDVLWGTPFGAIVEGYDTIHSIHASMIGGADPAGPRSVYTIERTRRLGDDAALAFVRRRSGAQPGVPEPGRGAQFDELTLFVLVRRDGGWWLAAAQHVPDRRDVYG